MLLVSLALSASLICGASLARAGGSRPLKLSVQRARAAVAEALSENEYFRVDQLTQSHIIGRGHAVGAVRGTGATSMILLSASKAKGEFSSSNSTESVTAKFVANYDISGETAYFSGSVTSIHGTGKYAGAVGEKIGFYGKMSRLTETMTMSATGRWRP